MAIQFSHLKAAEDDFYIDFPVDEYHNFSGISSHSANFKNYFTPFISEKITHHWQSMLIGTHDLHFTEQLHHKGEIDIINAQEVKLFNSYEDFFRYGNEVFIPNFKLPFTKYLFDDSVVEGKNVYTLDFFLEEPEAVVFTSFVDSFEAELPADILSVFEMGMPYFHIDDFKLMHRQLPNEYRNVFDSIFIDEYEPGKSILLLENQSQFGF